MQIGIIRFFLLGLSVNYSSFLFPPFINLWLQLRTIGNTSLFIVQLEIGFYNPVFVYEYKMIVNIIKLSEQNSSIFFHNQCSIYKKHLNYRTNSGSGLKISQVFVLRFYFCLKLLWDFLEYIFLKYWFIVFTHTREG